MFVGVVGQSHLNTTDPAEGLDVRRVFRPTNHRTDRNADNILELMLLRSFDTRITDKTKEQTKDEQDQETES